MSDTVWVSNIMNDPRQMRSITTDKNEAGEDGRVVIGIERQNSAGVPLSVDAFPTAVWPGRYMKGPFKRIPGHNSGDTTQFRGHNTK
jgi:hypothetical protein